MTKTMRNLAGLAALVAGLMPGAQAAAASGPAVVLHIVNDASVPDLELRFARDIARLIYHKAGINIEWTMERRAPGQRGLHFEVLLLSRERTEHKCEAEGVDELVMGSAARPTGRAFAFYPRIEEYAARTKSNTARFLGAIIAHEVGHLLLPVNSHSPKGVMRATWRVPLVELPKFSAEQAREIQARVAADANAN